MKALVRFLAVAVRRRVKGARLRTRGSAPPRGGNKVFQLVHEVIPDGVANQFGVGSHVHLLEDAGAVGADGFHA